MPPASDQVHINASGDVATSLYFVSESPIFLLPPEMMALQGAHRYTLRHPFVRAIAEGPSVLTEFYSGFSPKSLAEMYRLEPQGQAGEGLAPWELPWLLRKRRPPGAEAGLSLDHGVSYYGPCTPQKVAAEHSRLVTVRDSIQQYGYLPEEHGHIEGHFLRSGDEFVFFVRGGKHRAAALVSLGFERIPVRIRLTWPRVVFGGTEKEWPLVKSGEVSKDLAERILDRYFTNV